MGEAVVRHIGSMAAAVLGAPLLGPTQVPPPAPMPSPSTPQGRTTARTGPPSSIEAEYGPAQPEDLERVAFDGSVFQRHNVIVRGALAELVTGRYLSLSSRGARVMLIPLDPADFDDFRRLPPMDVEVTGIVRVLPAVQPLLPCLGQMLPASKCEDPLLPVLPDAQPNWPKVSITVLKAVDRRGLDPRAGPRDHETSIEAAAAEGTAVKAMGQFRGANLCRDLPEPTRRDPGDWVLLTDEGPVWITGRRPEGRGFRLDPAYRGDVNRWLEVSGRVMISGQVRYVAADKVALVPRPPEAETSPCNP